MENQSQDEQTTWLMYAHEYSKHNKPEEKFFMHIGSHFYVKNHLLDKPILAVKVIADPNGEYYGWISSDNNRNNGKPSMIWPTEGQFNMCFPYGYQADEKVGKGKMVKLKIELDPIDNAERKERSRY